MNGKRNSTVAVAVGGALIVMLILVFGSIWLGRSARNDTEEAVRSVSLLYLDELAGRREQVVENNLRGRIDDIQVALSLMTDEDLTDVEHFQAYQARMKRIFNLEKFAFVDSKGLMYTSLGPQTNIDEYHFDYQTITEPEVSMDGYAATKTIRALDDKALAGIPILAMTANAFQEDVQAAKDAGMQGHIAKPIDINVLRDTLKAILK